MEAVLADDVPVAVAAVDAADHDVGELVVVVVAAADVVVDDQAQVAMPYQDGNFKVCLAWNKYII